jgi:hypothetical protein
VDIATKYLIHDRNCNVHVVEVKQPMIVPMIPLLYLRQLLKQVLFIKLAGVVVVERQEPMIR